MARSYFKQLMAGGVAAPLTPRRPISCLWKTARLERAAAEVAAVETVAIRRRPANVFPAGRTEFTMPPAGKEIPPRYLSKPEAAATEATFTKPSPGGPNEETVSPMPRPTRKGGLRTNGPALQTDGVYAPQPSFGESRAQSAKRLYEIPKTVSNGTNKSHLQLPQTAKREDEQPVVGPQHRHSESPSEPARAPDPGSRSSVEAKGTSESMAAVRESAILEPPDRGKTRGGTVETVEELPRAVASNAIHIGKIEVQVVPPPAVLRAAAPAPLKTRLARGYSLGRSWQQL